MSKFVNVRLPSDILLDPNLALMVDKLAINNPKWVFEPCKETYNRAVSFKYNFTEELQQAHTAPEGMRFVRGMKVSQDGEQLGSVTVDQRYSRNSDQHWHYGVQSWRIEKSRGARNTTYTTKLDMALRNAKKMFKPMEYTETFDKAVEAINRGFHDAIRQLREPILRNTLTKSTVTLQFYAVAKAMGEAIESESLREMETTLKSEMYQRAIGEYVLAERTYTDCSRNKLHVVVAMGNNYYLFKDENHELLCLNFDSLPEGMQNKLGVMHLMEDYEMVQDVGFRYNDRNFYIYR